LKVHPGFLIAKNFGKTNKESILTNAKQFCVEEGSLAKANYPVGIDLYDMSGGDGVHVNV
jgi:hypothetical protein